MGCHCLLQAWLVLGAKKGRKRDQGEIFRPGKVEHPEKGGPDGGRQMSKTIREKVCKRVPGLAVRKV